jgi:hypothetical protein
LHLEPALPGGFKGSQWRADGKRLIWEYPRNAAGDTHGHDTAAIGRSAQHQEGREGSATQADNCAPPEEDQDGIGEEGGDGREAAAATRPLD